VTMGFSGHVDVINFRNWEAGNPSSSNSRRSPRQAGALPSRMSISNPKLHFAGTTGESRSLIGEIVWTIRTPTGELGIRAVLDALADKVGAGGKKEAARKGPPIFRPGCVSCSGPSRTTASLIR